MTDFKKDELVEIDPGSLRCDTYNHIKGRNAQFRVVIPPQPETPGKMICVQTGYVRANDGRQTACFDADSDFKWSFCYDGKVVYNIKVKPAQASIGQQKRLKTLIGMAIQSKLPEVEDVEHVAQCVHDALFTSKGLDMEYPNE